MHARFLIEKKKNLFLASVHNLHRSKGKVVKKSKICHTEELVNKLVIIILSIFFQCYVAKKFLPKVLNILSCFSTKSYVIFPVSYCNVLTYCSFPVNFRVDSWQIFAVLTKLGFSLYPPFLDDIGVFCFGKNKFNFFL